jgi:hypothetical protein
MTMTIITTTTLLLSIQLDHGINPHDGNTSLDSTLQLLDLAHSGLQHSYFNTIDNPPSTQIKSIVFVILLFGKRFFVFGGRCGCCGCVGVAGAAFRGRQALG